MEPGSDVWRSDPRLAGHVAGAGGARRRRAGRGRLRGLLADPRLVRADPYPRLGVVWRTDARSRARQFVPFDLGRVLQGQADMPLAEGDEVVLLGLPDVLFLASPGVQQALRGDAPAAASRRPVAQPLAAAAGMPGAPPAAAAAPPRCPPPPPDCPALTQLTVAAQASRPALRPCPRRGLPGLSAGCPARSSSSTTRPCCPSCWTSRVLLTGEVRLPGLYPILNDTGLDAVLAAAGGATDTADLSTMELAREPAEQAATLPLARTLLDLRSRNFAAVRLSPRDAVRLPRGFGDRDTGPVTLVGEFVRPGVYDIRRGERLSEVIARAGGLTPQAYPYGAVFSRESVRQRQQEGFQRTARELEQGLMQVAAGQAVAGMRGSTDLVGAIQAGQALAGRCAMRAPPGGWWWRPIRWSSPAAPTSTC